MRSHSSCVFWHWSPIIGGLWLVHSHSSYLFAIGQSLLVYFGLYARNRLVFFDMSCLFDIGQSLLVDFDLRASTNNWWTMSKKTSLPITPTVDPYLLQFTVTDQCQKDKTSVNAKVKIHHQWLTNVKKTRWVGTHKSKSANSGWPMSKI